jgi:hypothetical protein
MELFANKISARADFLVDNKELAVGKLAHSP